jgi:uncharacterized protein YkwD
MHPVPSSGPGTVVPRGAANPPKHPRRSCGAIKRVAVVAVSMLIASIAATGVLAADPQDAAAAGGGKVKKCGGGKIFLNEKEKKTFALHNAARRQHHRPTLCVHPALEKAARSHSEDMIRRDYFSHDTKGRNEDAEQRIKRFDYTPQGFSFYMVGENIALGSGSSGEPDSIMRSWMNSDGHRRNILNNKFREVGIGTETGNWKGNDGVTVYTVDFGFRRP